jgi:hypothetical protein
VDAAVLPVVFRQRGSSPASRARLHLGNFLRTLATPEPIGDWSLTSMKEKLIKIGAKVVGHARYVTFQMAEVAIAGGLFADVLRSNCSASGYVELASGAPASVRRIASRAPIERRRAVSMTERMSA